MLGFLVIAERYLPDLVAWISLTTNDEHYLERIEARFLLALASKVQVKVYVTAHFKELLIRRSTCSCWNSKRHVGSFAKKNIKSSQC